MPLRQFKCPICGSLKTSFKKEPICQHEGTELVGSFIDQPMQEVLVAPSAKLLEPRDSVSKEMGKSVPKGFNETLKARSRNHARDNEISELVATNDRNIAKSNRWINDKGQIRKKIDDL